MAAQEYAVGEVIGNKYVVEGPLGDSPNGKAYLANAGMGSQKLCVKIFRPEVSSKLLSAPDFFLKAGVGTEMEHDNLAGCIEVQEEMGQVYAARAFVEGNDFEEWIRRNRREGNYFTRGMELLWQACQGLSALHERTRHLNIHPGNILISPLVAKLADWDPRSLGSMEMTPEPLPFRPQYAGYRAPEMSARGSFLSYPSTDLYAVAGLLYRLVMGEHPESDLSRVQAGIRSLEKDLGGFLAKAMHPRPEERYQDASSFSDALWELQGAMQRLQDRQPKGVGRSTESSGFFAPQQPQTPPGPPARREPEVFFPPSEEKTAPTLAMEAAGNGTFFGTPADTAQPAAPAKGPKDDSFFNFFPSADAPAAPAQPAAPARRQPPPPPPPRSGETFFGSSLESAPSSGGTLFGDPTPPPPRTPRSIGGNAGLSSLEEPGTLFGSSQPAEPPPRRNAPKPEAKPAAVTLSSLEKDPLEAGQEGSLGHTQFGFKGAGDRTLYSEGQANGQRKLVLALGAVGALVLLLALGGLFVYLRSTAAPEIPPSAERSLPEDPAPPPPSLEPPPASGTPGAETPATPPAGGTPVADHPPFPDAAEPATEPVTKAPPPPVGKSPPPSPPEAVKFAGGGSPARAPKGSPERLAQLMKMVETRNWPNSAAERLQAADELNDFGKVAEANVVYGRAVLAGDVNEKQKISALGGLAVTFYSMGMRDQAKDALNQILDISPNNAFAKKFLEKVK